MLHQPALQRQLALKNNNRTAIGETYTNYLTHATVVSLSIICLQSEWGLAAKNQ
jgi:hypothetical protein